MTSFATKQDGNRFMTQLTLVVANKNYSSWSMRPWVLMRELGIPFNEITLKFQSPEWTANIGRLSPTHMVPVLWEGEAGSGHNVWDTLAIVERLHELFPNKDVWPRDARARSIARSICAEMHSGFRALRSAMPMNIRSRYPGMGRDAQVDRDITRIAALWTQCRGDVQSGEFLFGSFCAADAFYAPVATRFVTYGVSLPPVAQRYADSLLATASVREWSAGALSETEFVAEDEPYAAVMPQR